MLIYFPRVKREEFVAFLICITKSKLFFALLLNRTIFLSQQSFSAKISFVQVPMDTAVPIGAESTLKCVTSSRVEKCAWRWRPLRGSDPEIVVNEFPSNGDLGRDCSLHLSHVYAEKQGHWSCQVSITSLNTVLTSPSAKLTVFEQGRYYWHCNLFLFVSL